MNILADSGHKDTIAGECCSCRIDGFSFLFVFFDSGLIDRAVPLCKRIYILAHSPLDLCFPVCSHTHRQSTPHENINGSFPIWPPMRWNPISKVFICICAASTRPCEPHGYRLQRWCLMPIPKIEKKNMCTEFVYGSVWNAAAQYNTFHSVFYSL